MYGELPTYKSVYSTAAAAAGLQQQRRRTEAGAGVLLLVAVEILIHLPSQLTLSTVYRGKY